MRGLMLLGVGLLAACVPGPGPGPMPEEHEALPPNGGRGSLECEAHGVRAWDASRTLIPGAQLKCAAHLADRTGAPVSRASVSFLVEADRANSPGVTTATGTADVTLETATPLPIDTEPGTFTGRRSAMSCTPVSRWLPRGWCLIDGRSTRSRRGTS